MGKRNKVKFEFGTDFQELILNYTVTDLKGFKALELYNDSYFVLIHHAIIALALKKYYKKHKIIPEEPYLREFLRLLYQNDKSLKVDLLPEDKELISDTITRIYSKKVNQPDVILENCVNFARYIQFKSEMENVDINNFHSYESSIERLKKANTIGTDLLENYGTFIVKDMPDRAFKRDTMSIITPTPFWQMNSLLNSGGTEKGNVIVLVGKEKDFKTGGLINVARGYMKMRKKGFYVDLENGEIAITVRSEQSLSNKEQELIRSGDYDEKLMKLMRKYKRIGAELLVKRFPNLTTTCASIQSWLDRVYQDLGIKFDFGCIDYGLLLGAISGKSDDFNRISDAFLDIKNLAEFNNLDALWTGAHVDRKGVTRRKSVYESTDIAKCIDIPRHVDCLLGMQQNEDEEAGGVLRMEVIEQRNGMRNGKMLFWLDIAHQRIKEFSKAEVKEYWKQVGNNPEEPTKKRTRGNKKSDL